MTTKAVLRTHPLLPGGPARLVLHHCRLLVFCHKDRRLPWGDARADRTIERAFFLVHAEPTFFPHVFLGYEPSYILGRVRFVLCHPGATCENACWRRSRALCRAAGLFCRTSAQRGFIVLPLSAPGWGLDLITCIHWRCICPSGTTQGDGAVYFCFRVWLGLTVKLGCFAQPTNKFRLI